MEHQHFKAKAGQIVYGVFALLFAILIEVAAFFGTKGEDSRVLLMIAGNVILVLPIGFTGFAFISGYVSDCKNIKKALEKYGEDKIKAYISAHLEKEYTKKGQSVYFTDKVIVDFSQGVIPYNMIAFAHLTNVKTKYNTLTSITVKAYDGEIYTICEKITGQEGEEYLLYLKQKNPNIMLGYSDELEQKYNELTDKYKKGEITIEDTVL